MMDLKVTVLLVVIVLIPCVGFIAGQSSSLSPSPSIQQSTIVNQTATPNASVAGSLTIQSTFSTTVIQHQTSSVQPSAVVSLSSQQSSVSSTPQTTSTGDDDEEDDKEENEKKKKETALIAACSAGAAVLITGLILIIYTHRKNHIT